MHPIKATAHRVFSFLLFFFLLVVGREESMAQSDSLMYLGHASVKIKTSAGKIIYIDPYAGTDYADSADVLLVTHAHSDHNQQSLVKKKATCTVITYIEANQSGVYKNFTVGDIKIDAVAAYNANHAKNACVGYVLEFDGIRLYHSGDTGKITEMADLAARDLTYALLCMDGIYTMSPEEATQAAAMINAKYYMPIHTMPPPDTYSDAIVARFTVANKIVVKNGESIALTNTASFVEDIPDAPTTFSLEQNYPNPFNPSTVIKYQLPVSGEVTLAVYDLLGRRVAVLVSEKLAAGRYSREWNAAEIPSGVYFCRLNAGSFSQTRKIILMK
jgi:L-ascorbate metabolism protein UlaG (beta-lactamase superfamily)